MTTSWIALQLTQLADSRREPEHPARFNPHPPGVSWPGSATAAVLAFLRDNPRRYYRHHEILKATGRTKIAVDWALIRLKTWGLIEYVPDEARNPRYLRYRAVEIMKVKE